MSSSILKVKSPVEVYFYYNIYFEFFYIKFEINTNLILLILVMPRKRSTEYFARRKHAVTLSLLIHSIWMAYRCRQTYKRRLVETRGIEVIQSTWRLYRDVCKKSMSRLQIRRWHRAMLYVLRSIMARRYMERQPDHARILSDDGIRKTYCMPNGRPPLRSQRGQQKPLTPVEIRWAKHIAHQAASAASKAVEHTHRVIETMSASLHFFEQTCYEKHLPNSMYVIGLVYKIQRRRVSTKLKNIGYLNHAIKYERKKKTKLVLRKEKQTFTWLRCSMCEMNGVDHKETTTIKQCTFRLGHDHDPNCAGHVLCVRCYIKTLQFSNPTNTYGTPTGPVVRDEHARLVRDYTGGLVSISYGDLLDWLGTKPCITCPFCRKSEPICGDFRQKLNWMKLFFRDAELPPWNNQQHDGWGRFSSAFYHWFRYTNIRDYPPLPTI